MSIQQGDPVPHAKLFDLDEKSGAPRVISASERFAGKRDRRCAVSSQSGDSGALDRDLYEVVG